MFQENEQPNNDTSNSEEAFVKKQRIQRRQQSLPNSLPPSNFYGKRKSLCSSSWFAARTALRRKWRRLSQLQQREIATNKINGGEINFDQSVSKVYTPLPTPWTVHRKQQLAFDEADEYNSKTPLTAEDMYRTFSVEIDNKGKRTFMSTTLKTFWNYYSKLKRWQRHHYEIIRENKPCRLYFDCEFYYQFNPHMNTGTAAEELMEDFFLSNKY